MEASETQPVTLSDVFWENGLFRPILILNLEQGEGRYWYEVERRIREVLGTHAWIDRSGRNDKEVTLNLEGLQTGEYMCSSSWVGDKERYWDWHLRPRQFRAFGRYANELLAALADALPGIGGGGSFIQNRF